MRDPSAGGSHAPSGNVQRAKDVPYVLRRLWAYLSCYRALLVLAVFLSVGGNLLTLMGPKLSGRAVNAIQPGAGQVDFPVVYRYVFLMAVCYLVSAVMAFVLARLMIRLSQKTVYAIRRDLFDKLVELPVQYFDIHSTGDIVSRISYDVDTISSSLSTDLVQVLGSVITVAGSFAMMLSISWRMALVFCVSLPVTFWFANFRSRKLRPMFHARSVELGRMNGFGEEILSGFRTIKAYGREREYVDRFEAYNQSAATAFYRADYFSSALGPCMNLITNVAISVLSVVGALLYMAGGLSLGDLSSFILYSRKFSSPINETANIIGELQGALAAAERVFRVIDEAAEQDPAAAQPMESVRGEVRLEHVSFGYAPDRMILKDVSLTARPGSQIAVVGPTGAGKTTFINLLMRFYDPQQGRILLDGRDLRSLPRTEVRRAFAMVLQDTWLFDGTIYENIAYGRPNATREQVEDAARAAHIHDYIVHLQKGYDTVISADGTSISKGQKQLLTIARAMLLDSPMLILDEATSNVDTQTELRIQKAVRNLMKGRTCFIIAHRLSTIQNADCILVMQNGQITESGAHHELLAAGGLYAKLYYAQFS